jgi:hypothetical protein
MWAIMIDDCLENKTDIIVLVSGDSDLLPPLELIQQKYPLLINGKYEFY